MGAKPSKQTPKDRRLKKNRNAPLATPSPKARPVPRPTKGGR